MATPVFILAWERPIYLWVTLDSLFRHTPVGAADFIMLNNGSRHPMVRQVIAGFERRGMFAEVVHAEENRPQTFADAVAARSSRLGDFFGFVEGDVELLPSDPPWIVEMLDMMRADPQIGYLGSLIDARDFVDVERAQALAPHGLEEERFRALLKAHTRNGRTLRKATTVSSTFSRPADCACIARPSSIACRSRRTVFSPIAFAPSA